MSQDLSLRSLRAPAAIPVNWNLRQDSQASRRSFPRLLKIACVLACAAVSVPAGPVDFGLAELNAAMSARNLKWRNKAELSLDPPESFRIEPYSYGGAHITGGDLRGLMYGLLEAAEQVRSTGRLAKAHATPATRLRGVRIALDSNLEDASESFWRAYFQMLARNRFNRANVVFPRLDAPYRTERLLSQIAADYGVDFTLSVDGVFATEDLEHALAACPLIRSVGVSAGSPVPDAVIFALRDAGRRVTLDFEGLEAAPLPEAPSFRGPASWPPSFEIEPARFDPGFTGDHALLYWIWGRLAYDPGAKVPKNADAGEYRAAHDATLSVAALREIPTGSDYVASPNEAERNRSNGVASAKLTALEIVTRIESSGKVLDTSASEDFRLLASMARDKAAEQRASIVGGGTSTPAPRPKFTHAALSTAPFGRDLTLTLQIAAPKDVTAVRLHYGPVGSPAGERIVEQPPSLLVTFTIPGSEVAPGEEIQYYFEILNRDLGGWFEPDPLAGIPAPVIKVDVAPPLQ